MGGDAVHYRGRSFPIRDRMRIGGRTFFVLSRLGARGRVRLQAWDTRAGATGMRSVQLLPKGSTDPDRLRLLQRLAAEGAHYFPQVLEIHSTVDEWQIVMQWVEGQDLARRLELARQSRAPWPSIHDSWILFGSLARGLKHLHRRPNLVHGDIRPENLIVARGPNRLVMVDFGSAWCVERTATRSEGDGKSGPYASPEQHRGEPFVDFRSDQFSASVVAYQLLTGATPYDKLGGAAGNAPAATSAHAVLAPPTQQLARRVLLPPPAATLLDRCLSRGLALTATDRFETDEAWVSHIEETRRALLEPKQTSIATAIWSRLFGRPTAD